MNIQLQRLIRKYEFLLEDWQDVKEISQSANQEMSREIHANKPDNILESDFTTEEAEEDDGEREESVSDSELKKLFRKVVIKCHPDKLDSGVSEFEKIKLAELYDQAIEAHDDKNWALMIIVAIKLGVDLPAEADDMLEQIEEDTVELEEKISKETSSIAWQFYHADEEGKAKILQNYLKNLAMIKELRAKKAAKKKLILGLGHPRTGTGYTAKLLQSWGLDVGHEKMGEHGTVDWSLSFGDNSIWQKVDFKEFNWQNIIYCVRDPRESIASIIYTENKEGFISFKRRKERLGLSGNDLSVAIQGLIKFDDLILKHNPIIYRIEDGAEGLFKELRQRGLPVKYSDGFIGTKWNTREHEPIDKILEQNIQTRWKNEINRYCEKYGYDLLFG